MKDLYGNDVSKNGVYRATDGHGNVDYVYIENGYFFDVWNNAYVNTRTVLVRFEKRFSETLH